MDRRGRGLEQGGDGGRLQWILRHVAQTEMS
jgi:hypothetical protein